MNQVPFMAYLMLSLCLFSIGMAGVLIRRNVLIVLMCLELMFNAVNLILVAFSTFYSSLSSQLFVFFIMIVAAVEVAVGLALMTLFYRKYATLTIDALSRLKG